MSNETCQATTESGEGCKNPAQEDGYCWVEGHGSQSDGDDAQARDPKYDPGLVAEAIRRADGNLTQAAELVGCHRFTVHRYCNDFEQCAQARDQFRGKLVDKARKTIGDKMESDDESVSLDAAKFAARHYDHIAKERSDVTSGGEPVDGGGGAVVVLPDNGRVDTEGAGDE